MRSVGFTLVVVALVATAGTVGADPPVAGAPAKSTPWASVRKDLAEQAAKPWPGFVTTQHGRRLHKRVTEAVAAALRWLAAHQSPDGRWDAAGFARWCDGAEVPEAERTDGGGLTIHDVGVTALALNALLVAGHAGAEQDALDQTVRKGLAWLASTQDEEGCFGARVVSPSKQVEAHSYESERAPWGPPDPRTGLTPMPGLVTRVRLRLYAGERKTYVYNHAIAALAMVEAFGLTGEERWKTAAQRGLDFVALARNPYSAWRYGVKPGDNDTSVTGWMMLPLETARRVDRAALAAGQPAPFTIDDSTFDGIKAWIHKMTDADYGHAAYVVRGTGSGRPEELMDRFPTEKSEAMTAVGMLARTFLGEDPRKSKMLRLGADLCGRLLPTWNPTDGSIDMIYWHFGTLAMYQVAGSPKTSDYKARRLWYGWVQAVEEALVSHQRSDGTVGGALGSWDPIDPWGPAGGRVYATAINALTLLTPVRYAVAGR